MSHTYVLLPVSQAVYDEIKAKLAAAGYEHASHEHADGPVIDMHGIALQVEPPAEAPLTMETSEGWKGSD